MSASPENPTLTGSPSQNRSPSPPVPGAPTPGNPQFQQPQTPETSDKWVLSVICWKVENLSPRFPIRHQVGDDNVYAVCGFQMSGDMKKYEGNKNQQLTDTHRRARLEGSAIFHHRWVFEVPPAYKARFAFPELKIQLRSEKKEHERKEACRAAIAKAKESPNAADLLLTLDDPDSEDQAWPQLHSETALAEGTLALHDLFTAADQNYKHKRDNTRLGEERPLRLQMRATNADVHMGMQQTEDDKTIMLLTLELACGDENATEDRVNVLKQGRLAPTEGMKTTSRDPREKEYFNRAACGENVSKCTPL